MAVVAVAGADALEDVLAVVDALVAVDTLAISVPNPLLMPFALLFALRHQYENLIWSPVPPVSGS